MSTDYNAGLYCGTIKQATDFGDINIAEYGFGECLEEFCQDRNISFIILGYDESKEAVIGKCLSYTDYYKDVLYSGVDIITQEEMDRIDKATGQKCKLICCLSIS
jgi:hypothetical protein